MADSFHRSGKNSGHYENVYNISDWKSVAKRCEIHDG